MLRMFKCFNESDVALIGKEIIYSIYIFNINIMFLILDSHVRLHFKFINFDHIITILGAYQDAWSIKLTGIRYWMKENAFNETRKFCIDIEIWIYLKYLSKTSKIILNEITLKWKQTVWNTIHNMITGRIKDIISLSWTILNKLSLRFCTICRFLSYVIIMAAKKRRTVSFHVLNLEEESN